jgi:hypothetical protein
MLRPVLIEFTLFLIPFALYALYIVLIKRGSVFDAADWPMPHVLSLAITACLFVVASLIVLAHWNGAPPNSTYIPAHIENGKFVPGETR